MSGWAYGFQQDGRYRSSGAMEGRPGVVWGPPGNHPSPKQTPARPGGGGACGVGDRAWKRWVRLKVCGGRTSPGESTLGGRQGQPATGPRERCGGRGAGPRRPDPGRAAPRSQRVTCAQARRAQARVRVLQARVRGSQSAWRFRDDATSLSPTSHPSPPRCNVILFRYGGT